ncbi:D-2-hydroxyacid dehydrogenase family protein [Pseudomonas chlororaphis]|uniref:D-2-hydroxyacid dehydrogenase family protein n=1 Tax=Pseudomonas chlororaphis TaxID=587753 RepID=UPI00209B1C65|nr:D-2-hydroxyacid dehydrogenase family protein [Pseudomonas chlororaphis]MCO7571832.1 D-2-hydroxyacid dehydrogenase family protein [Pseudomonas chlororaphis]MCO7589612.1 D-2-hydroxyacid dehydrogenase family protein [Pseudomonas chlororaphis]
MTLQIAVIDDWQDVAREVVDWSVLQGIGQVSFLHDYPGDREILVQRLLPFQVICVMRERTLFDAALLQRLPQLKLLLTGGMRNAAIDLEAAKALGIQVCGSDSYRQAAPELTWALLMALTRNLLNEANALRAGHWQQGLGGDLYGKTLGLLGLGNIGQRVAQFGQVFGMRVIAWSQNLSAERAAAAGVTLVSKQALFEQADVLSVHLVLSERSRHLVDAQALAWMKPDALLVNTARGPIVDEAALIAALEQGRLAGAALDVFAEEPLPAEHPFRRLPNVLATPHIGYVSRQNYRVFFSQMIEDLQAWHAGRPIRLLN